MNAPAGAAEIDMPPPERSHFVRTLAYVYENDPKLSAEREDLKTLDERVAIAYSGFRPNASASIDYGRRRSETNDSGFTYGDTRTRSVNAEQPIFNGFGTLAEFRAAKQRVAAGRAQLWLTEEQVMLDAIAAYLDLAEKQQLLDLNRQNVENIRKQRDGAEKRFKAGDGTRTDIAQAESRLAEAESGLARVQGEWAIAGAAFERATGLASETLHYPAMPANLPDSLPTAKEQALNAPELLIAMRELRASKYDINARKSSLWPSLSLRGSMGDELGTTSAGSSKVREDRLTLNLRIPLYQGGAEYARVREAKTIHNRLEQEKMDTARSVIERTETQWHGYHASRQVIETSNRAAVAAEEALKGITTEHQEGVRIFQDVLDAQNELLAQQVTEIQAQKNVRLEAYRLLATLGKLTAQELALGVEIYEPTEYYDDNATRWAGF